MIKPEVTYTETNYLYKKFSNEQYKPYAKWVTSNVFTPDPILTSKEYIESIIPQDNIDINIDKELDVVTTDISS